MSYTGLFQQRQPILLPFLGEDKEAVLSFFGFGG
jgi:hypothetical protein